MELSQRKKLEIRALADASNEALIALAKRAPIGELPGRKSVPRTKA